MNVFFFQPKKHPLSWEFSQLATRHVGIPEPRLQVHSRQWPHAASAFRKHHAASRRTLRTRETRGVHDFLGAPPIGDQFLIGKMMGT